MSAKQPSSPKRLTTVALIAAVFAAAGCGGDSAEGPAESPSVELDQLTPRDRAETTTTQSTADEQTAPADAQAVVTHSERLGRSVEGRPITALVVADPPVSENVLVVGCIHGDEPAGGAVTSKLAAAEPPPGVALWLVDQFNPDGCAAGTRQNANGVDLNRNSPWRWRPLESPGDTYYSGTGPLSEPESRAINALVNEIEPAISIWYHQHAELVDRSGGDEAIERRYAELVGLPFEFFGRFPGSITSWQNDAYPDDTAFVVELPAGELSSQDAALHADAVLELAQGLVGPAQPSGAAADCEALATASAPLLGGADSRLDASGSGNRNLWHCRLSDGATRVNLTTDSAPGVRTRYDYRVVELAQFAADNPRLAPKPVDGVGDPELGPYGAQWVASTHQLLALRGSELIAVDVFIEGAGQRQLRAAAIAITKRAFELTG